MLVELSDMLAAHLFAAVAAEARAARRWSGVQDVVIGHDTVTVLFDPAQVAPPELAEWLSAAMRSTARAGRRVGETAGDVLEFPVCFDGPDLEEVASLLDVTPAALVAQLAGAELEAAFLGFAPGFAYLGGLPPPLAGVPRRARPRPTVPAGAVALGGGFAAVYPQATPGGWQLLGRTGVALFDPGTPPYALLAPGRRVRLVPTDEVPEAPGAFARPVLTGDGPRRLVVERGGTCSLVEDEGRIGTASLGVPRAGFADPLAARLANRLLGNAEDAALVEVTLAGPKLRATADVQVVVVGDPERPGMVEVRVDGRPVPERTVLPLAAGQALDVGSCADAVRAVVAVEGGLRTPLVLGSRSSDQLCGLGPGALSEGDVLEIGPAGRPHGRLEEPRPRAGATVLRVVAGPDVPAAADAGTLLAGEWLVGSESNRVGVRLRPAEHGEGAGGAGSGTGAALPPQVPSRGMVRGAVQLPPGGEAVVLGPDHATVGGYPVAAVVVGADLHRLAHVRPGEAVRFELVDADEAGAARGALERAVDAAVRGWFPTRAG